MAGQSANKSVAEVKSAMKAKECGSYNSGSKGKSVEKSKK